MKGPGDGISGAWWQLGGFHDAHDDVAALGTEALQTQVATLGDRGEILDPPCRATVATPDMVEDVGLRFSGNNEPSSAAAGAL